MTKPTIDTKQAVKLMKEDMSINPQKSRVGAARSLMRKYTVLTSSGRAFKGPESLSCSVWKTIPAAGSIARNSPPLDSVDKWQLLKNIESCYELSVKSKKALISLVWEETLGGK